MAHRLIVQTTKGRLDSLKHDVNIVFTLTPKRAHGPEHNLVVFGGMHFPSDSEADRSLSWDGGVAFATYEAKDFKGGKKKCVLGEDRSPIIPAGMASKRESPAFQWEQAYNFNPGFSIVYLEPSGLRGASLVKYITCQGVRASLPIVAWPAGHNVGSSPGFLLQALVVEDPDSDGTILGPHEPIRALFAEPLDFDALPDCSAWILTEDDEGILSLEKTDIADNLKRRKEARLLERGVGTLEESFGAMKKQFDTLVKSLEDTQLRLLAVETAIKGNQTKIREAQTSLAITRDEIARLDRKVPDVAKLAAAFNRTEERLALVEISDRKAHDEVKALAEGHIDLAQLGASVQLTEQQASAVGAYLATIIDLRMPSVEAKTNRLEEPLSHIQDQRPAATTAVGATRGQADLLNSTVPAVQGMADQLEASMRGGQDRLPTVEERAGRIHGRWDVMEKYDGPITDSVGSSRVADVRRQSFGIPRSPSLSQDGPTVTSKSLTAMRQQVIVLARKLPALEAKVDRTERLGAIMERKLPTVEARALLAEKLAERTQEELAALRLSLENTRDEVAGLGSRVADVEIKALHIETPWDENEPHSPAVFPSQSHLDPL